MLTKREFLKYQYIEMVHKLSLLYIDAKEKAEFVARSREMDIAGEFLLSVMFEGKFNPFRVCEVLLHKLGENMNRINVILSNVKLCILQIDL